MAYFLYILENQVDADLNACPKNEFSLSPFIRKRTQSRLLWSSKSFSRDICWAFRTYFPMSLDDSAIVNNDDDDDDV